METNEKLKLNRKLAEWVGGIKHDWTDEVSGYKTTEAFCENCGEAIGYTPFPCVPNFTQSLDACFKWLVPDHSITRIVFIYPDTDQVVCIVTVAWSEEYKGEADMEEDALALCLAIEKLIEKEGVS